MTHSDPRRLPPASDPTTTTSDLLPPAFGGSTQRATRPLTTAEQVADGCGLMIVEGRLSPGERVGEERLADLFGVSRGPVREALRILEKRRLVEIVPRRGAFVRSITLGSIADLFNVRNALAAMAAGTFAGRTRQKDGPPDALQRLEDRLQELRALAADPACAPNDFTFQLTRLVYATILGSGNLLLLDIWRELNENTFWTTIWKVPQDGLTPEERQHRLSQVETTVEAIRQGDSKGAENSIRGWLDEVRDRVLTNLEASRPSGIR
ncbi:MAG: GntR family transcriptional regulator [Pseudodonghicola sp.]